MLTRELRELLKPMALAQRIVWFAITGSIGVFVVIAQVIERHGLLRAGPAVLLGAAAAAAAVAGVSHWQYRRARGDEEIRRRISGGAGPLPAPISRSTSGSRSPLRERYDALPDADKRLLGLLLTLQRSLIVSLALHETIAMIGFLLAIFTGRPALVFPFAAAAVALNVLVFPKPENELERARKWSQMGMG